MSARAPLTVRREPTPRLPANLQNWGWAALLVACCTLAFGAGALSCLAMRQNGMFEARPPSVEALMVLPAALSNAPFPRTNLLVMGTDVGHGAARRGADAPVRSDTMIVASLDCHHNRLTLLSIARDTKVTIPGRAGEDKINAAMAYGGPELACKTVSTLLGVPIHHWVRLKLEGLATLVDAVGGVDLDIEKPMRYRDRAAHLSINLKAGRQHLNGEQAEQYVRFRMDENGDIGRVQRQQLFIRAMAARLQDPGLLARVPRLFNIARDVIETDLSTSELLRYANWAKQLRRERLRLAMLPGSFSGPSSKISYWLVESSEVRRMATRLLTDATASAFIPVSVSVTEKEKKETRVTILNGTRRAGLGSEAARLLREDGWIIWSVGTASRHDRTETEILTQRGDDRLARAIAQALRVAGHPSNDLTPNLDSDFTVVLGDDFTMALRQLRLKGQVEEDAADEGASGEQ